MNMAPIELEDGRAVFAGEPGEEHYKTQYGVVHGGYAATILDSALGCAVHTTLPAGVGYTSLGLEVKYLRPISRDTTAASSARAPSSTAAAVRRPPRPASRPKRTGKLLATGTSTLMIFGG